MRKSIEYYKQKYSEGWDKKFDSITHDRFCNCELCCIGIDYVEEKSSLPNDIEEERITTKRHSKTIREPRMIHWEFIKTRERITAIDLSNALGYEQQKSAAILCGLAARGFLKKIGADKNLSKSKGRPVSIFEVLK